MKVEINKFEKGEIAYLPINELSKNSSSDDIYLSWLENNFNYLEKINIKMVLDLRNLGLYFLH